MLNLPFEAEVPVPSPWPPRMILSFDDCEIDLERREFRRAGTAVHVEPQVFDLLAYLAQNGDRVVSKDEIFASVWKAGSSRTRR